MRRNTGYCCSLLFETNMMCMWRGRYFLSTRHRCLTITRARDTVTYLKEALNPRQQSVSKSNVERSRVQLLNQQRQSRAASRTRRPHLSNSNSALPCQPFKTVSEPTRFRLSPDARRCHHNAAFTESHIFTFSRCSDNRIPAELGHKPTLLCLGRYQGRILVPSLTTTHPTAQPCHPNQSTTDTRRTPPKGPVHAPCNARPTSHIPPVTLTGPHRFARGTDTPKETRRKRRIPGHIRVQ